MGIFSFLGQRGKALTGTPAVLETLTSRQFSAYPALGGTNLNTQRIGSAFVKVQNASYSWVYLYQPPVRRTIDYIARNISQLGLKCFDRISDDEREHVGDHPAAETLRNPNPQTPGNYFIKEFVKAHLIYGNAYALKFREGNGPLTLVSLNPAMVGIVGQSHFEADAYRIYKTDGTFFDVAPADILRWPATTGDDPRHGESYLETLRELLAADAAAQGAIVELHRSGLSLPGWLERPIEAPVLTPDASGRLSKDVSNRMKKARTEVPIFEEGMTYKTGGVSPEDAELLAGRRFTFEQTSSIFGMKNVPPEGEEERRQFYADVLPPLCEQLAAFLDLHILKAEFGRDDYYFEFNLEEKQMSDDRLKAITSAVGAPPLTRNEGRAMLNKPALPGGDELITPLNVTEGGKPSTGVMPIQDPNKPPQDGSHRTEDVPVPPGKALVESNGSVPYNGNGHHKAHLIPRQAQIDHSRNIWGGKYEEALFKHFSRQQRSIVSRPKSIVAVDVLSEERWDKGLAADLLDLSQRHLKTAGDRAAFRVASEFDPDYGQNWLTVKAEESAKAINKTTREHVEEMGVTEAFALALSARAPASGKGYATDVNGFATKVALEQDPNREVRSVTITGGECDICAEFQGTYAVDEVPAWPGYHPGCGCYADIDSGSKSIGPELELATKAQSEYIKTIQLLAKAVISGDKSVEVAEAMAKAISNLPTPQVNVAPAETHIHEGAVNSTTTFEAPPPAEVTIAEGAVQVDATTTVEAPPPAEVTIQKGAVQVEGPSINVEASPPAEVNVAPAETHIHKGAVQNHVKVDAPSPAEVNVAPTEVNVAPTEVRFGKGAINVEAPPPANVNIEEGAIKVEPTNVIVEPPKVDVTTPPIENHIHVPRQGQKKVTFSDGSEAVIEETDE